MDLDQDELKVRKYLTEVMIAPAIPAGGRVIPAPIYFNDSQDYWNTIETVSYGTQQELEKSHIMYCALYFINFVDIGPPQHSPLFGLLYEIDVFSQYEVTRSDENLTPDAFNKKMLASHNEFVACCLKLKDRFQGLLDMGLSLSESYAIQRTTPLVQSERVQNKTTTEFIPGINGHRAKFTETVQMQTVAC